MSETQESPGSDFLTTKEAAEFLNIPLATAYFLAKNNRIPSFRIEGRWRFSEKELRQYVASRKRGEIPPKMDYLESLEEDDRVLMEQFLTLPVEKVMAAVTRAIAENLVH